MGTLHVLRGATALLGHRIIAINALSQTNYSQSVDESVRRFAKMKEQREKIAQTHKLKEIGIDKYALKEEVHAVFCLFVRVGASQQYNCLVSSLGAVSAGAHGRL